MYKLHPCVAAALVATSAGAYADTATEKQEPIIVTATRTARTADESLASVTVITREDIENSKALSVPELLRGIVGVDMVTQGGFGKLSSAFVRGTNAQQVLVLIDGLKFGSVSAGATAWEFVPISEIERIEIVRGPRSSLYGSEAIGGVIQIFTRTGEGPPTARVEAGAGTEDTRTASAGVAGRTGRNWYNLSVSRLRTEGIDAREPTLLFGFLPLDEPDKDGFHNDAASLRYGHRFGNGAEVELFGTSADGNTEFDATTGNEDDFQAQAFGTRFKHRQAAGWNLILEAGRTRDRRRTFRADSSVPENRFDSEIDTLLWQNDISFGTNQVLTVGADYRDERIDSTVDFKETERNNKALFAQYQKTFKQQDLLLGVRQDDNEQFGRETTGNLAWGYTFAPDTRFVVSYGTGFRAPTFNDLFFPDFSGFPTSNPNLKPERSRSFEFGVGGKFPGGRWDAHTYHTEIKDLIALDQNFIPQNLNEAKIDGVEVTTSALIGTWTTRLMLSFVDPRDQATGNVLPRRAKETLRFDLERPHKQFILLVSLVAQGPRFDDLANTVEVPGYGIVDFGIRYRLNREWEIGGRVNNLFDKDYQTVDTFNELGRNVLVTLAYRPQVGRDTR